MDYEDQPLHHPDPAAMGPPNYADPPPPNSNSIRPPSKLPDPLIRKPKYKECLKNHALAVGGHAVDGCGEFMPAGEDGTIESLRCAACNCHRNFHRRETEPPSAAAGGGVGVGVVGYAHAHPFQHPAQQQLLLTPGHFGFRGPGGGYLHSHMVPTLQRPPPLALPSSSAGGGGSGSRDEMEDYYSNPSSSGGKKRFRTKFTQEQKEKMLSVAARLDWKIQKQDEEIVQQLCSEIGVKRHVFKVWMHNNKNTLGKKL